MSSTQAITVAMHDHAVTSLPVYPHLGEIAETLARDRILLLMAETGAGKTTLVPWNLLTHPSFAESKILLLQPRRIAARAAAERIASLRGEQIGRSVGLRTRIETIASADTRLEVVTEGVLTRIIQNDPSLAAYGTIIFDEFHERNLQADIGLAFVREIRADIRPDLRILFMSATLNARELGDDFGAIPLITIPGRSHPVRVHYRPPRAGEKPWEGMGRLIREAVGLEEGRNGDVLVFLPGFREIRLTAEELERSRPVQDRRIVILHGRMPPEVLREILDPSSAGGRIILSTNVAETGLTIPGVRVVVDSGLERRVRYEPRTGMNHWRTVPVSRASAEQRRGRAGRLGPGACLCWWSESDERDAHAPPEIVIADLAPLVLETACWGAPSPGDLTWITKPPAAAVERASELLRTLGFLDVHNRITATGRQATGMGLHPRLARMVIAAGERGWLHTAAAAAAIIAEDIATGDDPDFRNLLSDLKAGMNGLPSHISTGSTRRIVTEAGRIMRATGTGSLQVSGDNIIPDYAGKLLLLAYPDRAARRTGGTRDNAARWVLASGRAARASGALAQEEFLAVAELDGGDTDARIFLAAPITISDIEAGLAGELVKEHSIGWEGWKPICRTDIRLGRMSVKIKYGQLPSVEDLLLITEKRIRDEGVGVLPWNDKSYLLINRCRFIQKFGHQDDWPDLSGDSLQKVDTWLIPFVNVSGGEVVDEVILLKALGNLLGWKRRAILDELAPEYIILPSGSNKRIDYSSGDVPVLAARIQELFGMRETPCLCEEPLILHLLSPAGRPVQITRDLDGFWDRSYPDVRKELMGRYPKHFWPDNPRSATPTSRSKPKKK